MAREMGIANRHFIEAHYSAKKMAYDALSVYESVLRKKSSSKVIICGYYGYGNIGDEATLCQTVKKLKRQNISDITVLSKTPKKTAKALGIKAIYRYNIFFIIDAMRRADAFLLGGGNLLQNQTSNRSLYYYVSVLLLAKRMGARCFYFSSGIGELHGRRATEITKKALSLCEKITVRTESDKKTVKSLLKKANAFTVSDAVFLYEGGDFSYLELRYSFLRGKKYAVFSLREPRKGRKRWAEELSDAISRLYEEEKILPIFIPFHKKKDERITKEIIKRANCGIVVDALSSDEVVYLLKGATFSSGMRMHLMIFSLLAETPHLLLSYDKKCKDMLLHLKNKADELNLSGNFLKIAENGYFNGFSTILNERYDKRDFQALCEYMRKRQINFF
jgi:polysaccharide pyruvyl transferase CsaB